LRIPRSPSLPSWHAYSKIGLSSRVSRIPNVHGFTHVVASSNVIDHSMVLFDVGRKRSVILILSEAPPYADFSRTFVVSMTSVSPSQCPRASPMYDFRDEGRCAL